MLKADFEAKGIDGLAAEKATDKSVIVKYPRAFEHGYVKPEVRLESSLRCGC